MRQKSGLQRAILDQRGDEFRQPLAYKMEWNGAVLLATPPYHTSQTCPDEGIGGSNGAYVTVSTTSCSRPYEKSRFERLVCV